MLAGATNQLTDLGAGIQTATNMLAGLQPLTNMIPNMDYLTNQMTIFGPTLSNVLSAVTNDVINELARILTRPTSILFGTTTTFLYKTRPGYNPAVVWIRVRTQAGVEVATDHMTPIVPGIYQQDLTANWARTVT